MSATEDAPNQGDEDQVEQPEEPNPEDTPPQFPGDVGEAPDQAEVSEEVHEEQDRLTEEATPEDQEEA